MLLDPALATLMRELGARIGLGELQLDDEGLCALRFDGRLDIDILHRPADEELWFYTDFGPVKDRPDLLMAMLRGNLFWRGTLGATLSLSVDEPPHAVLALATAWRPLDTQSLASILERFVNTAEDWRELLQTEAEVEASGIAESSAHPEWIIRV